MSLSPASFEKASALSGERYIAAMTTRRSDCRARRAFLDLAMRLAAPGSVVLDFGAGPGLDARELAAASYRVCGYDIDPEMRAAFERVCRDEILGGHVTLWQEDYGAFLRATSLPSGLMADLVVANFAPINLVESPRELFRAFHALTVPHGRVLLSILNPYYLGDSRYRWWWKHLLTLVREGQFALATQASPVYRRTPGFLASAAAPHLRLDLVERGLPTAGVFRYPPLSALTRLSSRYLILEFTKKATAARVEALTPDARTAP